MTDIAADPDAVTMINVFTVDPEHQHQLVDLLTKAIETVMGTRPGFLAGRIHRGLDGTRVAVVARWRSPEDFQALAADPQAAAHMARVRGIAAFEPVLYEVVRTHRPTWSHP
jgi:heme-degrading monooxygenase HmoA